MEKQKDTKRRREALGFGWAVLIFLFVVAVLLSGLVRTAVAIFDDPSTALLSLALALCLVNLWYSYASVRWHADAIEYHERLREENDKRQKEAEDLERSANIRHQKAQQLEEQARQFSRSWKDN